MEIISHSSHQTQKVGQNFGSQLKSGGVLLLYGDLGSGKTTFIQGLAKGLSLEVLPTSPTFVFVQEYKVSKPSIKRFYHVDLYRLESDQEIKNLGILDMVDRHEGIIAIEWAEKLGRYKPRKHIAITFRYKDHESKRIITINEINSS